MSAVAPSGGGGSGPGEFHTDFAGDAGGGLIGLRAMIENSEPSVLDNISSRWTAIHEALTAAQTDLETHTTAALTHWEGDAADGFATRADQLYQALGNGAAYAFNASSGVSTAADALRVAKQTMPSMPGEMDRLKRKLTSETNDHAFRADLSSGMSRTQAIKLDGGELSLMEERHQQAVAVMETLEMHYNSAAQMIGEAPVEDRGTLTVWPPPPPTTKRSPVTGKDGSKVADPAKVGGVRLAQDDDTKSVGPTQTLDPSQPESGSTVGDGGPVDGVSGGEHIPAPPDPSTTIQGVTTGVGGTAETGGAGGVPTGTGPVSGVGGGEGAGGVGEGGIHGFSGGMSIGAGAGRSGVGADGEGRFAESSRMAEGGLLGAEESGGSGAIGEGFIEGSSETRSKGAAGESAEGGPGMMGGPGGAGKQGKKRKRRARAHYLVEDEESWASGVQANPAVIT